MNTSNASSACAALDSGSDDQATADYPCAKARKILVAISPSPSSHEALTTAVALARPSGAPLALLQTVELNIFGEERGIARGELLRELMNSAESRLIHLARARCDGLPFSIIIREGPPGLAIVREAHRCGAEAIVLGPRRPGRLSWLRRNNLRAVLQNAGRPVYIADARENPISSIPTPSEFSLEYLHLRTKRA